MRTEWKQLKGEAPRLRTLEDVRAFMREYEKEKKLLSRGGRLKELSPADRATFSALPPRRAARRRDGSVQRLSQHRWAITATKWNDSDNVRTAALCPWCGKLVLDQGQSRLPTTHHAGCRHERRSTPEYRDWWNGRLADRKNGRSKSQVDRHLGAFPPMPAGRVACKPDREMWTRNLKWAIEYLLATKRDPKTGLRVPIKLTMIARGSKPKVSETTVSRAITETLEHLPIDVTVPKPFARLIADLRLAASLRS